jgi:hypothetical protein
MKPWQFRQKTPGFGISSNFYMTVLAATAQLPTMRQVVDPKGAGGAVVGFGVPLAASATKEDIDRPLTRGVYGIASHNRQTVLKLMAMPKEEAGFDPAPLLRSSEAKNLTQEHLARISATWSLLQFTFQTHEAMVYPSLKFLHQVLRRFAELTDGVISDPISRVYKLPAELEHQPQADARIDARDHVQIKHGAERGWVYTLGLQKFALPELEVFGVPPELQPVANQFLIGVTQAVLTGNLLALGGYLGSRKCPLQIATGGLDRGSWEGIPCFELIPPSAASVGQALLEWSGEARR